MRFHLNALLQVGCGLLLAPFAVSSGEAASKPDCNKSCLLDVLKNYQAKMLKHDTNGVAVTSNFRSTENYRPIKLGEAYWQNVANIYHQIQIADPVAGQVVAIGMLKQAGKDGYYSLRLKIANKKISQSEMFIVKQGEATFFNEDRKARIDPIYTTAVAPAQRSSRETLLKLVDSFNDAWQYRNEDLTQFAADCNFYENNVKLNDPNGPSGPTCGGIVEYGGKNGVRGTGKAGNAQGQRPPGQDPNAGGDPDTGGPPATLRPADASIGRPQLFGSQMWMRDRRNPIVDVETGVVFGYVVQGGETARPGETIKYERGAPLQTGGGPPQGDGAAYMFALYKVVNGQIVRVDHYEREGGPNASGGFDD